MSLATLLFPPEWSKSLQPASFRGIQFVCTESEISRARRLAIHVYPGRDEPYAEDLGRANQELSFHGFLVGDDVYAQRDRLAQQCDIAGRGTLVHPSIGSVQANLTSANFNEHAHDGRMVSISLRFLITAPIKFPSLNPKATNSLNPKPQGVLNTVGAAISDFAAKVTSFVSKVTGYVTSAISAVGVALAPLAAVASTLGAFAGIVMGGVGMAFSALSAVRGLTVGQSNVSLGRYSQGNINPPPAGAPVAIPQATSSSIQVATTSALSDACTHRAEVVAAISNVKALALAADASMPQAVADLIESARQSINDPRDQIAILVTFANFNVTVLPSEAPLGAAIATAQQATAALCRRCALASIANAVGLYHPTSSTETRQLIDLISPLFDAEITFAADNGDLNTYIQLRQLMTDTVALLQSEGSQLPELIQIKTKRALPSLVLSQKLYQTASRSDDLIQRSAAPNPCFMPLSFEALSV